MNIGEKFPSFGNKGIHSVCAADSKMFSQAEYVLRYAMTQFWGKETDDLFLCKRTILLWMLSLSFLWTQGKMRQCRN